MTIFSLIINKVVIKEIYFFHIDENIIVHLEIKIIDSFQSVSPVIDRFFTRTAAVSNLVPKNVSSIINFIILLQILHHTISSYGWFVCILSGIDVALFDPIVGDNFGPTTKDRCVIPLC